MFDMRYFDTVIYVRQKNTSADDKFCCNRLTGDPTQFHRSERANSALRIQVWGTKTIYWHIF